MFSRIDDTPSDIAFPAGDFGVVPKLLSLPVFFALVALAAASGAQFMPGPWYETLNKPSWTPPNWIFPLAWTILYVMIAVASWLAWRAAGWSRAIAIWGAGLVLNALWSDLMFRRQDISAALIDIACLWLAVGAFVVAAWHLDRRASILSIAYWLWVTFAGALNFAVWRMTG